ncbi:hypothetical protein EDD86DRAFT_213758 [Gorgonomyces haynaldii]|nr:hypothetical protein EDD86DRAFT_213758 [Gorgonomyces haynaldii]
MELAGALQVNTSLSTVLLSGCSISASALIALGTVLQSNNSVDRLDISNNAVKHSALSQTLVSNVMTHWGRALETNYGLKTLSFAKMGITDWTMCDFLAGTLHNNQNLTTLDLSCNKITRDGGAALCKALESHAALNNLKLSCCSLQDEGAEAISHLLQVNRKIRVLHLDYNKITGKGLAKIAQGIQANYSLVYIALWGNVWSVQACEAYLDLVGGIVSQVAIGSDNAAPVRRKGRLETDVVFYKVEGVLNAAHHETMQSIIPHQ